jgi:hypothetical protein
MPFRLRILAGALLASAILAACSQPIVSSIEVKASPTVYASLGTSNYQLSSFMSASAIQGMLGSSSGATVYDYQDSTDNTQKFLVHYPLTSVPLDVAQYLNGINLSSTLSQSLDPGSFQVPGINQTQNQSGTFDLNAALRTTVNGHLSPQGTQVVETGMPSTSVTLPDIALSIPDFSTATFASGSLQLVFATMTGQTPGFALTASNIALIDDTGTALANSASSADLVAGGSTTIPLNGLTLSGSFKLRVSANTSGGTPLKQDAVSVTPSLSPDTTVSAAQGLNLATSMSTPSISIPVNSSGTLVGATVGAGTLTITQGALPAGWTGFTRSTSISLSQAGGLSLSQNNQSGEVISFDLTNKTLNASPISVAAASTITAVNASFSGLAAGPLSVGCTAAVNVSLFSSITVQPGAAFTPTQTFSEPLGSQILQWVQSITFSNIGMTFSVSNTLPAGNPMTILMTSNALGITSTTPAVLPSGQSTAATFANSAGFVLVPKNSPNLDFTITFEPQSYNSATGQMTLNNIAPGSSLSIGGSVTPVDTWTQAVISPPSGGYSGTFPSDGSKVDLSSLASYLGSGLGFKSIPAYLYVSGLPLAANMTGLIQANYTGAGSPYTLLSAGTGLTMLSAAPTFPAGSVITAIPSPSNASPIDFSPPLNAEPGDLSISYSLNVNTVTVTPATANSTTNPTVQADLVFVLPLSFMAAAGGATLSFDSAMPATDLFGRNAGQDSSNVNSLLSNLKSLTLTIAMTNTTGLTGNASMTDSLGFTKTVPFASGASQPTVTLTTSDIQHVISTIPFAPKLRFAVGQGSSAPTEIDIQRGGGVQASATVSAVTDIDQTFTFGKEPRK